MKIPFEFAEVCCSRFDVLSIFNRHGARLNFYDRTILIPDDQVNGLKKTLFMGSVISCYEKIQSQTIKGVE